MRDEAAVSWGEGRIDLFWRDDDDVLWHRPFDTSAWGAAESLGGSLASGPAVTAWAPDQMEVFAVFPDGALWNRYWDGDSWHAWESLGDSSRPASPRLRARGAQTGSTCSRRAWTGTPGTASGTGAAGWSGYASRQPDRSRRPRQRCVNSR